MSLAIAGMGWVTPLGNSVHAVWERLLRGDEASATPISEQFADRSYSAFRVPESAVTGLAHPRLRRGSVILRFAATAGLGVGRASCRGREEISVVGGLLKKKKNNESRQ